MFWKLKMILIIAFSLNFRKLILDKASMFQDSSMAIEAFLQHLEKAKNTKQLTMVKSVVDLIDYEFEPTLLQIATFSDLHTLKLPGKNSRICKFDIQWLAEKLDFLEERKDVSFILTIFPNNFWNK